MDIETKIRLGPFDVAHDLPRLASWLRTPHVSRWWLDVDAQLQDARERPQHSGHVLIFLDESPVGYIRWQKADVCALSDLGLHGIPEGSVDMDILIGEPSLTGQGIGRRAIQIMRNELFNDRTIPLIGMVTSVANTTAVRAIQAAGFSPLQEYVDPLYGRCSVFACRRSSEGLQVTRPSLDGAQPGVADGRGPRLRSEPRR
jgi:aminoglycoside 6'-N-acetyltransferase